MDFLKIRKFFYIVLFGVLASHAMHVQAAFFSLDTIRHFGNRITMCLGHGKRQVTSLGSKFCALVGYVGSRCYQSCHFWPSREVQPEAFQPKNVPEDLNEDIRVGSSLCKGCEVQIGENVVAQQVPVLDQGNLSADCAYHALKNATEIVKALSQNANNLQERVNSSEKARNLFGRSIMGWLINTLLCYPCKRGSGLWRSTILNGPVGARYGGELLLKDDISYIISCVDGLNQNDISIIETYDILLRDDEFLMEHERAGINGCKEKNRSGEDYTHSFILSTKNGAQAQVSCNNGGDGGIGHWIAVVVQQKDGKRSYIVSDSKSYVRLLDPPFKALIHKLEGEEIAANIDAMSRNVQQGSLALIPEDFRPDGVLEAIGSILPLLKENAQLIPQEQVEQLRERVNKSREYLSVLSKRFKRDYVDSVGKTCQSNFEGSGIDYKQCYGLLGLSSRDAESVSFEEVQGVCDEKLKEEPAGPGGLSKWRQIRYLFGNSLMKQEYDTYCRGTDALLKLQQPNQVEFKQIVDKWQKLSSYREKIDGIIRQRLESQ